MPNHNSKNLRYIILLLAFLTTYNGSSQKSTDLIQVQYGIFIKKLSLTSKMVNSTRSSTGGLNSKMTVHKAAGLMMIQPISNTLMHMIQKLVPSLKRFRKSKKLELTTIIILDFIREIFTSTPTTPPTPLMSKFSISPLKTPLFQNTNLNLLLIQPLSYPRNLQIEITDFQTIY